MQDHIYTGLSLQNKRASNMDSLLLKRRRIGGRDALLAVVCDGVGSMRDGAFASGTAARELGSWFDALPDPDRAGLRMRDRVLDINAAIVQEAERRGFRTASTLSAVLFLGRQYHIVHVGDSRIYLHDGHTMTRLTSDDVSETGALTGYIGQRSGMVLQYLEGDAGGRVFLVCSDGLYKRVDEGTLSAYVRADSQRAADNSIQMLCRCAVERGETDNITAALIKIAD